MGDFIPFKYMKNILISGSNSRFAKILKKKFNSKNIFYTNRKQLDILNPKSIEKKIKQIKPKIFIHIAALSRPMKLHDTDVSKSIDLNIIGTSNVVKLCMKYKIKLIYFSTNYVYPGTKGNYKETDALLPFNNYAWSKLGGECAVQMYKNSLILRLCVTEKPFIHKYAFKDSITSFMFVEDLVKNFKKIINQKGIVNIGGEKASIYQFAKKSGAKVIPILSKKNKNFPRDSSMNINKFKKLI